MNNPTLTVLRGSLLFLFILVSVGVSQPAAADPCADWLSPIYWKTASLSDVERCLATSSVTANDENGLTALHLAAASSKAPTIITALIEGGADVNARDESGYTALHQAASTSNTPAIITALVDAGADVNAVTNYGSTPLHIAPRFNKIPVIITALINAGADVNIHDGAGKQPIDYARENEALAGSDAYRKLNALSAN